MRVLVTLTLLLGAPVTRSTGAPLPPPPRLSERLLTGTWDFTWGEVGGGTLCLGTDGTGYEEFGPHRYCVRWWLDSRDRLVLCEYRISDDGTVSTWDQAYALEVSTAHWPALEARTDTGTRVRLTGHR